MKDDTKFYTVTVFISLILTLISLYWVWIKFRELIKYPPVIAQPIIEEPKNENPATEDNKILWCLENKSCKG